MNIQTLKTKLGKGQTDLTKEVIVVIDNQAYSITGIANSVESLTIITEKKEELPVGDSIENIKERAIEEEAETISESTDNAISDGEVEDTPKSRNKKKK